MTEFILNNNKIITTAPKAMLLVDFIRDQSGLKGTKTACREGDCGSCTVILGTLDKDILNYQAVASCITPLGNIHGKHVVTIEGISDGTVTPVQQALVDAAATQCGYCTPGIVVSLTSLALYKGNFDFEEAKDAVGGNICRCTGYKSIERAIETIVASLNVPENVKPVNYLISHRYVPEYFKLIPDRLVEIKKQRTNFSGNQVVGGGTDLFVQKAEELFDSELTYISDIRSLHKIGVKGNRIKLGAGLKISELETNSGITAKIPRFKDYLALIGSRLIRNMATLGGNLVNASPIGDLSIIFLAFDASVHIKSANHSRKIKLREFFKAYKQFDLDKDEYIDSIEFDFNKKEALFNFEKVSKRKYLDIASVNSAITIKLSNYCISDIHISVGGVAPVPLYLKKTCAWLTGRQLSVDNLREAAGILLSEISPIDDVRGSAAYKSMLAKQLFFAHFIELFPGKFEEGLFPNT